MAWPKSNWISTDLPTYADFNNVALAFATWGGNVDGAVHTLSNLGNLSLAAGSKLSMPGQPHIAVHNHAGLSIPATSAWTSIPWDATDVTAGGITIASSSRLVAPVAGWYSIDACMGFNPGNAGNFLLIRIAVNGVDTLTRSSVIASASVSQVIPLSFKVALSASDYVEIQALNSAGVAVTTIVDVAKCGMTMLF